MSNKIKKEIYQEVNDSLNIVEVATRLGAANLSKRGNSFVGSCPTKHPLKVELHLILIII
jgi:DNA primase